MGTGEDGVGGVVAQDQLGYVAARRRAECTEELREALWKDVDICLKTGTITAGQAAAIRREFWAKRAKDELLSRGRDPRFSLLA